MNGLIENSNSRVCSAEVFILSTSTGHIVFLLCNSFNVLYTNRSIMVQCSQAGVQAILLLSSRLSNNA